MDRSVLPVRESLENALQPWQLHNSIENFDGNYAIAWEDGTFSTGSVVTALSTRGCQFLIE